MLRSARLRAGLSSRDAAEVIGCNRNTLLHLERADRAPSVALAERVAVVYRLTEDECAQLMSVARPGVGWSSPYSRTPHRRITNDRMRYRD
ncbi:helix-turn-helix transcriptional regulator [Pseudonocardia acidicola]